MPRLLRDSKNHQRTPESTGCSPESPTKSLKIPSKIPASMDWSKKKKLNRKNPRFSHFKPIEIIVTPHELAIFSCPVSYGFPDQITIFSHGVSYGFPDQITIFSYGFSHHFPPEIIIFPWFFRWSSLKPMQNPTRWCPPSYKLVYKPY